MGGSLTASEACARMQRGIALLDANMRESLAESLAQFDQAIGLRCAGLVEGDQQAASLLAASWMNRGDALTRLGGAPGLAEALRSYDEALKVLRAVPTDADPLDRRRHALAWINRGLTLHAQDTAGSVQEAIRSFERGMDMIRDDPGHSLLLAAAWVNDGNSLLRTRPVRAAEAQGAAAAALALVKATEAQDRVAAETSLKARLIVCRAVAERLEGPTAPKELSEFVSVATDAVETGLRLARQWVERGRTGFDAWRADLFCFGIAVYRLHQPQFLVGFILEHLHASDGLGMHAAAAAALATEARKLPPDGFTSLHTPGFGRLLETLRAARVTRDRLQELRAKTGGNTF